MKETRRVVTGHDEQGKAVVLMDGPSPHMRQRKAGGNENQARQKRRNRHVTVPTPKDNGDDNGRIYSTRFIGSGTRLFDNKIKDKRKGPHSCGPFPFAP